GQSGAGGAGVGPGGDVCAVSACAAGYDHGAGVEAVAGGAAMSKGNKNRVVEPHWRLVELPVVDATRCTGCGWCALACPTECLAMGRRLPWLPRPLDCVSCTLCALICPADAVAMKARE